MDLPRRGALSPMICADPEAGGGRGAGRPLVVGVLSDTHGHLYAEVARALAGVDYIIHAGDIGSAQVLAGLKALAPVTAVRGNCDLDPWAEMLPSRAELEIGGVRILVGHTAAGLRERTEIPAVGPEEGFAVVIYGHSHVAALENRDGMLHLNPGSAGPGRFGRPRTIARLTISPAAVEGPGGTPHIGAQIVAVPA